MHSRLTFGFNRELVSRGRAGAGCGRPDALGSLADTGAAGGGRGRACRARRAAQSARPPRRRPAAPRRPGARAPRPPTLLDATPNGAHVLTFRFLFFGCFMMLLLFILLLVIFVIYTHIVYLYVSLG